MTATRFEGDGPVARYWLANCEGFAVRGGERGTVEELLRDGNPHVTTRLVVRTRSGRRRRVVSVASVADVDPRRRVITVQRPPRRSVSVPRVDVTPALRAAAAAGPPVRRAASDARRRAAAVGPPAQRAAAGLVATVWPPVRTAFDAALNVLHASLRALATEAAATGRALVDWPLRSYARVRR